MKIIKKFLEENLKDFNIKINKKTMLRYEINEKYKKGYIQIDSFKDSTYSIIYDLESNKFIGNNRIDYLKDIRNIKNEILCLINNIIRW